MAVAARPITTLREVEASHEPPIAPAGEANENMLEEAPRLVRADPKPDPVRVAADQVTNLITNMDNATRMNWGETRGLMDQLMHEHAERGQEIAAAVVGYAQEAAELISTSEVIRRTVQEHLSAKKTA
jgi:hypothetical protein